MTKISDTLMTQTPDSDKSDYGENLGSTFVMKENRKIKPDFNTRP